MAYAAKTSTTFTTADVNCSWGGSIATGTATLTAQLATTEITSTDHIFLPMSSPYLEAHGKVNNLLRYHVDTQRQHVCSVTRS